MKVDPVFQLVVLGVLAKIERVAVARAILHLAPSCCRVKLTGTAAKILAPAFA